MKPMYALLIALALSACQADPPVSQARQQTNAPQAGVESKTGSANFQSSQTPLPADASQANGGINTSAQDGKTKDSKTQDNKTQDKKRVLVVDVYKSPTCSCCSGWIAHLEQHGFKVHTHTLEERDQKGIRVPSHLASCHTGVIDGKFIEGHVPAQDIVAFVESQTFGTSQGIAVPGMPIGTPGMEMGSRKDAYDVIRVDDQGKESVFISH